MRKFLSGALAGMLVISPLAPLGNITFAYDPTPSFTALETQAAGSGTSAVAAQIIDAITIT